MAKSVLVIDDDPRITAALSARLQAVGYATHTASCGTAGVEAALAHRPDVIILDVRMPDIDGHEVCRRLKARPEVRATPVIFLSANTHERQKAIEAGGAEFLAKPYEASDVVAAIERATQHDAPTQENVRHV